MSLTIKAFLQRDGKWDGEIRRFQIPADVSSSYDYLSKKLCDIFPSLRQGNFSLFWKDPDGDHVSFSTDEELMEALGFVSDSVFKVFIVLKEGQQGTGKSDDNDVLHPGVVCDGCEMGPICGPRYKCLVCPDYDLCRNCEASGMHVEHDMMKITAPGNFPGGFAGFPFGGPPGPHGPGPNGPFVPPPHFRRWMQRFMKRWHNKNAQGSEGPCGQKEGETEEKKDQDQKMEDEPQGQDSGESSGEEYLRNVGEAVAQMLDPFGIDVDIDVEKHNRGEEKEDEDGNGEKKGHGGRGRGRARGRGCSPRGKRFRSGPPCGGAGPWGMWGWMGGCPMGQMGPMGPPPGHCRRNGGQAGPFGAAGPCGPAGKRCGKQGKRNADVPADKPQDKPAETPKEQKEACDLMDCGNVNMADSQRAKSPTRMDAEPSGKKPDENAWTLLNLSGEPSGQSAPQPEVPVAQPPSNGSMSGPSVPIYPPADPKIAEALQQMTAMGFSNEGGWLTNLLMAKNGDIIQVLDAIRPNQRPKTSDGGTHA